MPRLLRLLLAAFAALVLPLAVSGAAVADGGKSPKTWTVLVGSESSDQAIQGMAFLPEHIYINAGDKITWKANSAEIHTVTFLAEGQSLESTQPFDPSLPQNSHRQGGKSYDGHSYYNSGIMSNVSNTGFKEVEEYTLKFPDTGEFTYYCLVHGMAMKGTVHVRDAGTDYPFTQSQYDHKANKQEREILRDGQRQWDAARDHVDSHTVIEGTDNGTAMVMRFVHRKTVVHVGESVTFVNNGMGAPHTVTFGTEPADPFVPLGDPSNFTGGDLNSGFMTPGTWFKVTFNKAGEFDYICALHDFMGMKGTVEVRD
ncbi:plastocyanin/azurin family copper-binding protein [Pseudarthrobacter sp. S9]|uniref:plastocyanin/azurin family copper-binding protein n=1 Tax=Pseudarthrobacter sp. S9 TaxID=3418421 RepID=UPI003D093231